MTESTARKIVELFDALDAELLEVGHTAHAAELEAQLDAACASALRQMAVDAARKRLGMKALYA